MNVASVLVICIVAGLLIVAVTGLRKNKTSECEGNCVGCAFQCGKKSKT